VDNNQDCGLNGRIRDGDFAKSVTTTGTGKTPLGVAYRRFQTHFWTERKDIGGVMAWFVEIMPL